LELQKLLGLLGLQKLLGLLGRQKLAQVLLLGKQFWVLQHSMLVPL
jgi:hypothetical protein